MHGDAICVTLTNSRRTRLTAYLDWIVNFLWKVKCLMCATISFGVLRLISIQSEPVFMSYVCAAGG